MSDATLVVVAHDDTDALLRLLTSLSRLPDEPAFDAIVVDDGASDEVQGLLALVEGDVRVVRTERRVGFGPACDRGVAATGAGRVVLLEEHARPVDGWLEPLLEALQGDAGPAAVRPRAIRDDGRLGPAHGWTALAVRRAAWDAAGGFAGTERPGRAEKATLLDGLRAHGDVREEPASQVLV